MKNQNEKKYEEPKEHRFIVSFTDSVYDIYMNAMKKLNMEDSFEIEIIDTWKGKQIPRVYTLYRKESTSRDDVFSFKNEIADVTKGYFKVLAYPMGNLSAPLMAIEDKDTSIFKRAVSKLKEDIRYVLFHVNNSKFERIFARIELTDRCCDKYKKKYLYWKDTEHVSAKSTDLPIFLFKVMNNDKKAEKLFLETML